MTVIGSHFLGLGVEVVFPLIGVAIVLVGLVWLVGVYNGVQRARVRAANAFSQIDVQLKRRFDLIPNLVEVAKGYMAHERETLQAVIAARSAAQHSLSNRVAHPTDAGAATQLDQAVTGMEGALSRLLAVAESYPDLKANQNMLQVQEELTSTENRIAFARQAFNDASMRFNELIVVFPNNIIAGMFGFQPMSLFQAEASERATPNVAFTR